jgi:hypothetical protein
MNQPAGCLDELSPVAVRCRTALLCLALAPALLGCVTDTGSPSRVAASQFKDLIVPSGLNLQQSRHESFSDQVGTWRIGHFVYRGSLRAQDAIAYVQQRAPQHGWETAGPVAIDEDNTTLRLVRSPHTLEYKFTRTGGYLQVVADYRTDY